MTLIRENVSVEGDLNKIASAKEDEVTTLVIFELPFRLHLEGNYKVRYNGMDVEVGIGKNYNIDRVRKYLEGTFVKAEKGDLYGDKWGRFAFNTMEVRFPKRIIDENLEHPERFYGPSAVSSFSTEPEKTEQPRIGESRSLIKRACRDIVNRIIDSYRLTVEDYFVKPVNSSTDIPQIRIIFLMNNEKIASVVYDTVDCAFAVGGIPNISTNDEKRLNELLLVDGPIPFDQLLMMNARYFLFDEDFRTAVLTACNALEIFIFQKLYKKFEEKKYDEPLINHLLHRPEINLMLGDLFKLATSIKISEENNTLWGKWTETNKLRNDITHPRKTEIRVSVSEAKKAIETISELMLYCEEKLK